jgi:hypothetical protein
MSGLRGDLGKLRGIEKAIRTIPTVVAQKVATAAAATITSFARETFAAGQNAYGDTWEPGADGNPVTLRKTGRLGSFAYVAIGTKLRAQLGPKYARYQVGRRPILPRNGARLPLKYVAKLRAEANRIIHAELGGAT